MNVSIKNYLNLRGFSVLCWDTAIRTMRGIHSQIRNWWVMASPRDKKGKREYKDSLTETETETDTDPFDEKGCFLFSSKIRFNEICG